MLNCGGLNNEHLCIEQKMTGLLRLITTKLERDSSASLAAARPTFLLATH